MSTLERQPTLSPPEFSQRLLGWFADHGRKDLPWQRQPTPYRVWVSEIMLQQTQVTTVIPYYERFLARFPAIDALADAPLDEVLHLWAGLGYYARARYLHRAAGIIRDRYGGEMPLEFSALAQLPGIGRSTAGAILALAAGQRHPILDGNVKRVLARFHAIEGWPGRTDVLATLWELAERYTPTRNVAEYTQAMMDLGALLCTRGRPRCHACPVADYCQARRQGRQLELPTPRPARELPVRATRMLLLCAPAGEVLLEKRPPTGIWGGLWSLPECSLEADLAAWCYARWGLEVRAVQPWSIVRHTFSHFQLDITPVRIEVDTPGPVIMEAERFVWYNIRQPEKRGLAAPVQRLLNLLVTNL
ncbi:MAG: A/G-specific adenine glycosylase [Candidatus Competibacteraceae bacterium]